MELKVLPEGSYKSLYEGLGISHERAKVLMEKSGELLHRFTSEDKEFDFVQVFKEAAEVCETVEEVAIMGYVLGIEVAFFGDDPEMKQMVETLKMLHSLRREIEGSKN